ncbi:MAG: hypothetical protein LUI06_07560 [Ruminococcus sp.]|nr:hypothetical protein [Ruminococcus sp.]
MGKSQTKQKKSSAGKNVAVFFIVFIILEALIIYGFYSLFENDDSVVSLGGYSFFIMDSSNMEEDVPKSALVIAQNGVPSTDKTGYAVLCKNVGDEGTTVAWLYDIGSKGDTVDGVVYTVYQEASPETMYDLTSSDVVGVTASYYLTVGKLIKFVITPIGMAACIAAPLVLMILLEIIIAVAHHSRKRRYDDDDDYDYDDEDDDEGNVSLDDFLYGGDDDNVYTTGKPKDTYEEEFEDKYAAMMNRTSNIPPQEIIPEETAYEEQPYDEQPVEYESEEQPVQEAPTPAVDPSYYEKASKMIDEAASKATEAEVEHNEPAQEEAKQPVEEKPVQKDATKTERPDFTVKVETKKSPRPDVKRKPRSTAAQRQDANAALEQLMKMMEVEQQRLRETSGINLDEQSESKKNEE